MLQYERRESAPAAGSAGLGNRDAVRVLEKLPADASIIRLFEKSDGRSWEAYQESATAVKMLVQVKEGSLDGVPVCLISGGEQLVRLAMEWIHKGKLEVWSWQAARRSWKIVCRVSAGSLLQLEEYLADEQIVVGPAQAPVIAAFSNDVLAYVVSEELRMGFARITQDELPSTLVQLGATELLIPESQSLDLRTNLTKVPAGDFAPDEQLVSRLLAEGELKKANSAAIGPLSALTRYLELLASDANIQVFRLDPPFTPSEYAHLDESALSSLQIFGSSTNANGCDDGSLFALLNKCRTRQGQRLLAQWLRRPLRDLALIEERQRIVEAFLENSSLRTALRENGLRAMPDLAAVVRRLLRSKCSIADLVVLYQGASRMNQLLDGCSDPSLEQLVTAPLRKVVSSLSRFAELIEQTIDLQAAFDRHEYLVKASFGPSLQQLASQKDALLDSMEQEYRKTARTVNLEAGKKIKLEHNSVYGHCFRVSRLDANKVSAMVELAALKNGIIFTTAELRELSNSYEELTRSYQLEQRSLVVDILAVARTYHSLFLEGNSVVAILDVLLAFAETCQTALTPWTRPVLTEEGPLYLPEARHPMVEASSFIPNTVHFSSERSFQIVTGPNMGGKSTYIRQTAIIALLAQIGCFVPTAKGALLPIFDAILVRVGAGDSLQKGTSTFMMEMLETASILQQATARSLVIIDELGRGTSTSEGFGLAWAISRHLAQTTKCYTFFATHYHELTRLSHIVSSVCNLHVQVHEGDSLEMSYRVGEGTCEKSYGVMVAAMAGFPPNVLDAAALLAGYFEKGCIQTKAGTELPKGLSHSEIVALLAANN